MNVYTIIMCILISSVSDYNLVFGRSSYDSPSYNSDRDENLNSLSVHQKKRLADDSALREDQAEDYERSGPVYETQRFRKYEPDTAFVRHDNRMDKNFDEGKMNMQKRDFFDSSSNAKDASIEVILDPRAKKAVAVVENSPNGQAMYDLTGWKNNKEDSLYDADQYAPGAQEQVVNLVYPAERNERKYGYETNSDYSEKAKGGFKDKMVGSDRAVEDSHKRKRNADAKKDTEKRSPQEKSKRKSSDQASQLKADTKGTSNECPPHNTPASVETENKDGSLNSIKFEKEDKTVKRETPLWSQEQLSALKNSLARVKDSGGEVQNLRSILSSMGLIDEMQIEKKRETAKSDTEAKVTEKRDETKENLNSDLKADSEDEDLNQDNIVLKRNNREAASENEEDIIKAGEEPIEKRDVENESSFEEEENEETFDEKKDVKRSNSEDEAAVENTNEESELENQSRQKRQNAENNQNAENIENNNNAPVETDVTKNNDNANKFLKRDVNSDKELRKNRENKETEEEYEKRMESQIQAKIDAIKEKVKREILEEQMKRRSKRNLNDAETLTTNIRKRRQSKEETNKVVKEEDKAAAEAQSIRRKRANTLPEKQMVYRAYQADQDEEAEEDGEFDDNAFDSRLYVEKRQADEENDYYDPVRKREVENYLRQYYPESRNRRSFDGYAEDNAFHGSRRALKNKRFSDLDNQDEFNAKSNENSDNEYFGSLPQTYNGELTRYKRVKRDNPYK